MADQLREQISALIDDECSAAEAGLIARRLAAQPELANCWQRYHLINDALNGQLPESVDDHLLARVRQAVAAEPELQPAAGAVPVLGSGRGLGFTVSSAPAAAVAILRQRPRIGIGVAAAASLAAVVGTSLLVSNPLSPNDLSSAEFAAEAGPDGVPAVDPQVKIADQAEPSLPPDGGAGLAQKQSLPSLTTPVAATAAAEVRSVDAALLQARLRNYLVNHNEYASLGNVHGVLPYVRQASLLSDAER